MKTLNTSLLVAVLALGIGACAPEVPEEENQTEAPPQSTQAPRPAPRSTSNPPPSGSGSGSSGGSTTPSPSPSPSASPSPSPSSAPVANGSCVKKTFAYSLPRTDGWHLDDLKKQMTCSDKGEFSHPRVENLDELSDEERARCQSPRPGPDPTIGYTKLRLKNDMTAEVDCGDVYGTIHYYYPGHYWYAGDMKTWGTFYCCKP